MGKRQHEYAEYGFNKNEEELVSQAINGKLKWEIPMGIGQGAVREALRIAMAREDSAGVFNVLHYALDDMDLVKGAFAETIRSGNIKSLDGFICFIQCFNMVDDFEVEHLARTLNIYQKHTLFASMLGLIENDEVLDVRNKWKKVIDALGMKETDMFTEYSRFIKENYSDDVWGRLKVTVNYRKECATMAFRRLNEMS